MSHTQAAHRYGKTYYLSMDEKQLLREGVRDATIIVALTKEDPRFRAMLMSEVLSETRKLVLFDKLFSTVLHAQTYKFLRFMLHKKRSAFIALMAEAFLNLYSERQGILKAELVTAFPLSEQVLQTLSQVFAAQLNKQLAITSRIDKTLLGGFTLYVTDKLYDFSLRGKLTRLKETLDQ